MHYHHTLHIASQIQQRLTGNSVALESKCFCEYLNLYNNANDNNIKILCTMCLSKYHYKCMHPFNDYPIATSSNTAGIYERIKCGICTGVHQYNITKPSDHNNTDLQSLLCTLKEAQIYFATLANSKLNCGLCSVYPVTNFNQIILFFYNIISIRFALMNNYFKHKEHQI
eukprot:78761_1